MKERHTTLIFRGEFSDRVRCRGGNVAKRRIGCRGLAGFAQDKTVPKVHDVGSAFKERVIKFASKAGEKGKLVRWEFVNQWDLPMMIERIDVSCGCLLGTKNEDMIKPGKKGHAPTSIVDFETSYDYDLAGRLSQVEQTGATPTATFDYGFEPSSYGLIETVTGPHHLVTNVWETTRNVLDTKSNTDLLSTPDPLSAYNNTVYNIGQRSSVDTEGSAFGSDLRDRDWQYNARGELISETDDNNSSFNRGFAFDGIGNRTASITGNTDPNGTCCAPL